MMLHSCKKFKVKDKVTSGEPKLFFVDLRLEMLCGDEIAEVKLGGGGGDGRGQPLGPIRPVAGFDRGELRGGKRKRRERQPNWETSEMFALVKAKKAEHDEHNVPVGDVVRWCNAERGGDLVHKWPKIAASVWNQGASVVFRNSESCKDKWGQLQGEYKKIRDYEKGRLAAGDQRAYWDLRSAERQELHLPKTFHSKRLYERMDEFLNENPPPTPRPNAFHPNAGKQFITMSGISIFTCLCVGAGEGMVKCSQLLG